MFKKPIFNFYQKQLLEFLGKIKSSKKLKLKYFIFVLTLLILPSQNYYAKLQIPKAKPVIRKVNIKPIKISPYPVNQTGQKPPFFTAYSVLAVDVQSKSIIFAKNPDYQLLPASTTKIMTALIALEKWQLKDILTVKKIYNIGQVMGLETGEKISVKNLLYGLLVESGNDAAFTLAENYPGGVKEFVKQMNAKAYKLNLLSTHFVNPVGIDALGHLTTAHDLAVLASFALQNKTFAQIVATPTITVFSQDNKIEHQLKNINQLVANNFPGAYGVKTGWTEMAGECLVAYVKRQKGAIITVVLKSKDRFGETKKLINWIFANFSWQSIGSTLQ